MSNQDGLEYVSGGKPIDLVDALKPLSGPEWEQLLFGDEGEM
ncbi:hypothetical protein [Amycolatopsis minnesotensis]|uniref:Uncharacterized protein n=1 Tax=Amycolatopsis minnesotensis TaxID=337894 RepID=A0ABP5C772_9PSEU